MAAPATERLDRATLVLGTLLVVALTCLSWQADGPPPVGGGAPGRTAVQGAGAAAGIAAAVVALVAVAWLAIGTLPARPPVAAPTGGVLLGLAGATLLLLLLKLSADLDGLARGAWFSLAFAAGLAASRVAILSRR